MEEISHKEIYDRILCLEQEFIEIKTQLSALDGHTKGLINAFEAAQGAFKVLEFLAKVAKPIFWLIAASTFLLATWNHKL